MDFMTDASSLPEIPLEAPPEEAKNPWAEQRDDFIDALESLYISKNTSGRLNFCKNWPDAAAYIFCTALVNYDENGVEDKEHRAKLEIEAEERRLVLLEALEKLEEKSIYHGSLQPEHVEKTVMALGRKIALYVYAIYVVDDLIPPEPGEKREKEAGAGAGAAEESQLLEDELSPTDLPPLENDVRPIDVSPPQSSKNESGLNLAAKRNIVQVDFIYAEPVSYADLVAKAAEDDLKAAPIALKMMFNQFSAGLVV